MVRLSEKEKQELKEYRDAKYGEDKPLGGVISSLLFEKQVAEQKQILITGAGPSEQYPDGGSSSRARVIAKPVGDDGKNLRGYNADLIILLSDIPDSIRDEVIAPMRGEVIELY